MSTRVYCLVVRKGFILLDYNLNNYNVPNTNLYKPSLAETATDYISKNYGYKSNFVETRITFEIGSQKLIFVELECQDSSFNERCFKAYRIDTLPSPLHPLLRELQKHTTFFEDHKDYALF